MLAGCLLGEFVETPISEGSRIGQREKLNCNAVATETSTNPLRKYCCWAGPSGLSQLEAKGPVRFLYLCTGCGLALRKGCNIDQDHFLWLSQDFSTVDWITPC